MAIVKDLESLKDLIQRVRKAQEDLQHLIRKESIRFFRKAVKNE